MAKKKTKSSSKSSGTKTVVFTQKPPKSAYFVGIEQDVPSDKADEWIKLGFAVDPEAKKKKEESKK